jgi:hypothetical protein
MVQVRIIAPENFNPDVHQLPVAGELLLAGAEVIIDENGKAYTLQPDDSRDAHGVAMDVSKPGDIVEVAASGEAQTDGGFYFSKICVLQPLN